MVVANCKMRRDELARLNTEKIKIHSDLEWIPLQKNLNFSKTHNNPKESIATLLSISNKAEAPLLLAAV